MKKLIKTLLILSIFVGITNICDAQTITADQFRARVSAQAKKDLEKYDLDDCEVTIGHVPVQSFEIPEGKISIEIVSNGQSLSPREFKKVNVKVNGTTSKTYYVPMETKAFKYVAVAKEMIQRDNFYNLLYLYFL